ncbi:MAG: PQQ-binding-like beta-propeller repeat protein [Candidatus Caldarchaeum sp.]|nr:PQQ-binding-like beta-propeller repeat protein [Candidatus Caldarchaeum sp.]
MVRIGGSEARIVFRQRGYTPHYAEYVEDPFSGSLVLVMADPHSRRSAYVYDPEKGKVVWEYKVPGSMLTANPHIARIATEELPDFRAKPGDILCADLDNRFIVVDRATKTVKWFYRPDDAVWSHDMMPTRNFDAVLTTDYGSGLLRKIDGHGRFLWNIDLGKGLAKLSRIAGKVPSGVHGNSFGGHVLAAVNQTTRGVYEIDEDNGVVVWSCPPQDRSINCFFTLKPHAAIRLGIAELDGNLTVFNHEAGGGFVAVDRDCRPRWGVMKPFTAGGREAYRPSSTGLYETTHVFQTPYGLVGIIDWDGTDYSTVYEILEPPRNTALYWLLANRRKAFSTEDFLDPPVETGEWTETVFQAVNHGGGRLRLKIYGTYSPVVDARDSSSWLPVKVLRVEPGGFGDFRVEGFSAVRVAVSSEGMTEYSVYVVNRS